MYRSSPSSVVFWSGEQVSSANFIGIINMAQRFIRKQAVYSALQVRRYGRSDGIFPVNLPHAADSCPAA